VTTQHSPLRAPSDEGMGLVEVVVALFILAILAVSFLPILIQGVQLSSVNATRASAGQLVNDQLEAARTLGNNCEAIEDFATPIPSNVTSSDGRDVALVVNRVIGACPVTYPGTVKVTATVVRFDDGVALAEATALIFVEAY